MPRRPGSADRLEDRRRRALALLDAGLSLHEVGRRIGCHASSVLRWREARQRGGAAALRVRSSPGRPPKLSPEQRARLLRMLRKGPLAHGYETDVWTTARIAELIARRFGVQYHRAQVGRLLHGFDWACRQPSGAGPAAGAEARRGWAPRSDSR